MHAIPLLFLALLFLGGCAGKPPVLGVVEGRLTPCPSTSNCVSSMEEGERSVAPLAVEGSREEAAARVKALLARHAEATLVDEKPDYLRAEFRSTLGFVDDVEFFFPPEGGEVHVRSASRVGRWDLGVNRRRVERLREELRAAPR